MFEFGSILVYMVLAITISVVLLLASYVLAIQQYDAEKVSAYECGFNPFSDARHKFDVRFYLVGILFIIFDLEVMYLFPWALTFNEIPPVFGYMSMFVFLFILTLGFIYEWKKGALDWQ